MRKIILDTNFLLIPIQFKVDIFSEIERICLFKYNLFVLDKTIDELNTIISRDSMKNKLAAKIALQLIKQKHVRVIKTKEGKVDDLILDLLDEGSILATQDAELRRKAHSKGAQLIVLRSKKHLMLK